MAKPQHNACNLLRIKVIEYGLELTDYGLQR